MIKSLNTKQFDLDRMLGKQMSYSLVSKSKNKKSNEDFLYVLRNNISDEYRKAILSNDWNNYSFIYEMYYNYKLNGGDSRYIDTAIKDYQKQYEKQQGQKENDKIQHDCILDVINVVLNDTKEVETVSTEASREKFIDFNERVYDTYMSPMIKAIEGTELDCHNIAEAKPKSFEEMSKEEKIEFVNKEIDDVLDFIERNKQAKYNKYKKEFCK